MNFFYNLCAILSLFDFAHDGINLMRDISDLWFIFVVYLVSFCSTPVVVFFRCFGILGFNFGDFRICVFYSYLSLIGIFLGF